MREKLQTLSLLQLRDLAKSQGIKGVTTLRKSELIDKLCEIDAETSKTAPESPKPFMGTAEASSSYGSRVQRENQNRYYQTANTNENGNLSGNGTGNSYGNSNNNGTGNAYGNSNNNGTGNSYGNSNNNGTGNSYGNSNNNGTGNSYGNSNNNGTGNSYGNSNNNGTGNSYGNSYRFQRNGSYYPRSPYKEFSSQELSELDSGIEACGILEVMPDGFGFIRCENFLPGDDDVYVAPSQIRRFNMKTGDVLKGNRRIKTAAEKFAALLYVTTINGYPASVAEKRPNFEDLTPIFPNSKLHLETNGRTSMSMRIVDLLSPIGKGQRGMIVSPPKAGKTTLLKQIAKAITINHPKMHVIILLIDERPEEVTDIKEAIQGPNVEVIYSTFDELPDHHKRVSEMVIERAKRLVEHGQDVTILLDSITRLARAYNLTVAPSGRTLSGGLDPAALHMPKRFFGAARNMREGGSLTILATALVETGSRMDDVIFEEFKGTGNMELVLDRKLSEKRLFPAIDILKSGTRRDDLLLTRDEASALEVIRRSINTMKAEESVERILSLFSETENNQELVDRVKRRQTL